MKPFVINRNSWHYALNRRVFNDDGWSEHRMRVGWEPAHNNFCAYWRATISRMIAVVLIAVIAIVAIVSGGYAIYTHPLATAMTLGSIVAIIAATIAIFVILGALDTAKRTAQASLFVQRLRTYKQAICPNIEYKERNENER